MRIPIIFNLLGALFIILATVISFVITLLLTLIFSLSDVQQVGIFFLIGGLILLFLDLLLRLSHRQKQKIEEKAEKAQLQNRIRSDGLQKDDLDWYDENPRISSFAHPKAGGHVMFLPVWIGGALLFLVGLVALFDQ